MSIFIIAEIGINHNGDLGIAKDLIKVAKESGCDAVKFQKRTLEKVYAPEELDKQRESPWGTTNREQKEGLEFGQQEFEQIDSYCKELGIEWFASAWDTESQNFLKQFDLKVIFVVRDVRGVINSFSKNVQTSKKPLRTILYY